jgi:hypothetical protein
LTYWLVKKTIRKDTETPGLEHRSITKDMSEEREDLPEEIPPNEESVFYNTVQYNGGKSKEIRKCKRE